MIFVIYLESIFFRQDHYFMNTRISDLFICLFFLYWYLKKVLPLKLAGWLILKYFNTYKEQWFWQEFAHLWNIIHVKHGTVIWISVFIDEHNKRLQLVVTNLYSHKIYSLILSMRRETHCYLSIRNVVCNYHIFIQVF